jgi:hypothetical protein
MVSMRIVVGLGAGVVVAAAAMWLMGAMTTATRPAKPMPATATFCLFMGTGTRFACKIRLVPSVSEVLPIRATGSAFVAEADGWTGEMGLS